MRTQFVFIVQKIIKVNQWKNELMSRYYYKIRWYVNTYTQKQKTQNDT